MAVKIPKTVGVSEDQVEAAERGLGCALPASFLAFVRDHDGAEPEDNTFDIPGNQSGVRAFVPLADAPNRSREIEGFPKRGLPVAEDGCGNYVWLKPETGEILFWDHEIESDGVVIASDFETFIAALQPFDQTSVRLEPEQAKHVWVHPDFKPQFD